MVQQIASAITLAVAALNVASGIALPMGSGSEDMDLLERDFDEFTDFDTRDTSSWSESDLAARAPIAPIVNHPSSGKASAHEPARTLHPEHSSVAPGAVSGTASAHGTGITTSPHQSESAGSKTVSGGPHKTVTKEHTFTLRPTPCGRPKKKGNGKGKQHGNPKHAASSGSAEPGHPKPSGGNSGHPEPTGAEPGHMNPTNGKPGPEQGKHKRSALPSNPHSIAHGEPTSSHIAASGVSATPSHTLPHPSSGTKPEITPAPIHSSAAAHSSASAKGGQTKTLTMTRAGKDGTTTVQKFTLVRPTGCAEPKRKPKPVQKKPNMLASGSQGHGLANRQGNSQGNRWWNGQGNRKGGHQEQGQGRGGNWNHAGKNGHDGHGRKGHGKRSDAYEGEMVARSEFELDELD